MGEHEKHRGIVKRFDVDKGYGFIVSDAFRDDVFVHYRDISMDGYRRLCEGDTVEFSVREREGKGWGAAEVVVVNHEGDT